MSPLLRILHLSNGPALLCAEPSVMDQLCCVNVGTLTRVDLHGNTPILGPQGRTENSRPRCVEGEAGEVCVGGAGLGAGIER